MRLILATGMLCVACFLIGAKVGQTASNGERIELPRIDPLKAIREREERKEAEREQERIETIMRNIEAYDGTGAHQADVPRG